MKVLFISVGRNGEVKPIIKNQGESLRRAGVELDYYVLPGRGWKSYIKNIKPLRKQICEKKYDVLHAHYAFTAYLVSIATMGLSTPMIVSLMGSDIWAHKWYPAFVRRWATLARWKAVIVKSKEMQNRVGMPCAMVVPNGVNMEKFYPMTKGDCQKHLAWDCQKYHVLFPANPEDPRKNWKLAHSALEMQKNRSLIELHGMWGVKNDETPVWYNAADAVVLPSLYEGSANAVKEAMACNCPLVTTDMGDCRERIEGVDGCYVANTYDVEEFAELLCKALEFGGKTKGRERLLADGIDDYQIAKRLIKIYVSVLNINAH